VNMSDRLRELGANRVHGREGSISLRENPLWEGPNGSGPNGGITFSMLSRFLNCRERFRLYAIEGLRSADKFNHKLFYGSAWHICEEATEGWVQWEAPPWVMPLVDYAKSQCIRYPYDQQQVDHWYSVCRVQFPIYVEHWKKNYVRGKVTNLLKEQVFDMPYRLPSGRVVRLRGKWDSVDMLEKDGIRGIYLGETKTKGDIKEGQIKRQLHYDLQTMFYLISLRDWIMGSDELVKGIDGGELPILGVRYNVIRRPLSGGKGTIVRKKGTKKTAPETKEHYYSRLSDIIKADPEHYFQRWQAEISGEDIERFRVESLDPILDGMMDWYDWVKDNPDPFRGHCHWRHPFGCYNVLNEGGTSDYDEYLTSGSMSGLTVADKLFEELG
jgi:hypothetical protein